MVGVYLCLSLAHYILWVMSLKINQEVRLEAKQKVYSFRGLAFLIFGNIDGKFLTTVRSCNTRSIAAITVSRLLLP